jgi:TRAP-type C4-dicarboxylate transport system substrate-binding protein
MDAINKATGGKLVVELKGGPEAVAPTAQMKPLSDGIYQILYTSTAYYAAEVPAATFNNVLIGSPEQLRAVGFYDIMDKMHAKKANAKFLMNGPYGSGFAVYLNKPITKADYTGFRIRATGFYKPLIDGLGGSTVGMPASDIYLAMQQKTVDGFTWPLTSFLTYKWQEVTKYIVKPYFGEYCGSILINLDAWNKLPPDLQDIVAKTTMQRESDDRKKFAGDAAKEVDGMLKAGMQIIDLPKAEADKYLQVFWDRSMAEFSKADPEFGPQLKAAAEKLLPQPRW